MTDTYVNKVPSLNTSSFLSSITDRDKLVRAIDWMGQHMPVRRRYVLTRDNRLRLRYVLPCAAALLLTVASTASSLVSPAGMGDYSFIARLADMEPAAGTEMNLVEQLQTTHRRLQRYIAPEAVAAVPQSSGVTLASLQPRMLPQPKETTLEIGRGDTLAAVLHRASVDSAEAHAAIESLAKEFDPRKIRPGQNVYVRRDPVSPESEDEYRMTQMEIAVDAFKSVSLKRDGEAFRAVVKEKPVSRKVYARNAPIEVSLYGSAEKAGVPNAAIAEVIRVLSWDIDFQRDIRKGDVLDVMYDQDETADGKGVRFGNVIFARMNIGGVEVPVYRYEMKDGDVDYFTPDGNSVRKALLKTPVDGARVSSGYGMRKHPVLGYSKMHKGVDFAAPTGTPIYAAGDGTIEKLGRFSSYGNYVRIRHTGNIKTAYAHLSKYGKGLSAGSRVKQGQIIGYVGATGRVTGAHLHYEVMMGAAQINPNSVKLPTGQTLKGSELASFKLKMQEINRQYDDLLRGGERMKVASLEGFLR